MIRKMQQTDINRVAAIWLDANIKAHDFIPAPYWKGHFEDVKEAFKQADLYICEEQNKIQGFVGLSGDYIAGVFVSGSAQSRGIGKQLLDFVKGSKKQLRLHVYQKNTRAVKFYQRENFEIQSENTNEETGETEYFMVWKKQ